MYAYVRATFVEVAPRNVSAYWYSSVLSFLLLVSQAAVQITPLRGNHCNQLMSIAPSCIVSRGRSLPPPRRNTRIPNADSYYQ